MKFLIVLAALAACAYAKPGAVLSPYAYTGLNNFGYNFGYNNLAYNNLGYNNFGYSAAPFNYGYSSYAAPLSYAAPAPVAYTAPAVAYSAPQVAVAPIATGFKSQYHAQDELGQASYGHSEPTQTHNAVQDAHGNKIGSYSYISPDGQVIRADYIADAAGYRVSSNALPVGPSALPVGPLPVSDTPEVVAARAAHLAEFEAIKHRTKRGLVSVGQFPAATGPLAYAAPAYAPFAYAAPAYAHAAYAAPAYAHSPLAYSAFGHAAVAPLAYAAATPLAIAAPIATPAVREATLTTVVNNPGHAVSYRVDK